MTELYNLSTTEASSLIREKDISSFDLTRSYVDRINNLNPKLHAFSAFDSDLVLSRARKVDTMIHHSSYGGLVSKDLLGIPYGVKDNINTKILPTQMGSKLWKGFVSGNDARCVDSLSLAGGFVLGKTVTAEFAVHARNETINPYNPKHIVGTSSSGSAVAVATKMCSFALATQTAGSIIRPSSYMGIFGMKPSFGLIPRTGTLKTTDSLDTIGFMSRTSDDLKLLLNVLRVKGKDYPYVYSAIDNNPSNSSDFDVEGAKIVAVKGPNWEHAEEYAKTEFDKFVKNLSRLQMSMDEFEGLDSVDDAYCAQQTIYDKTLSYYFQHEVKEKNDVSESIKEIASRGQMITLDEYKEALSVQNNYSSKVDKLFEQDFDFIITLSTGGEAPRGVDSDDRPDSCLFWTFCHLPVINIPLFTGPLNLPYGLQIVGRRYCDYKLIALAKMIQTEFLQSEIKGF
jgi:Asp-tRNA(Asn)/Glu-tRNA(Gln) amidotransferase A subunit family amidase